MTPQKVVKPRGVRWRKPPPITGGSAANSACAAPSTLTIDITIADGRADLDGGEIAVLVDQRLILNVKGATLITSCTSSWDDRRDLECPRVLTSTAYSR
jgi:hypothetical protein